MELQSLRTFQAVVEEGGILSASRKLNTVQSNVTSRIKRLEQEVGAELFYRKGRGLELSPAGKVLLGYAHQILQLESQAGMAMRQVGEQTGELRIGAMETFASLHLPLALKKLRQIHPGLKLEISAATSGILVKQVLDHKLDCAFVGGPVDHPDLVVEQVSEEELVLVHAKDVAYHQLPLVQFREGCSYRARAVTWQRESGHEASDIIEFGMPDGLLGCVAVGLGCSLVPSWLVETSRYRDQLAVEKIEPRLSRVPLVMVYQRSAARLKALDTLLEITSSQALAA
jgi:DNA-binding transcriptional LysR family regulator